MNWREQELAEVVECAGCGKRGHRADDETAPGEDEMTVDTARVTPWPNCYVCGACLELAEDAVED